MENSPFDVVAVIGSAGGATAAKEVFGALPPDFEVPLILMLHLAAHSNLAEVYRRLPFDVQWVTSGCTLRRGCLLLCPPRSFVQVLPDGTCVVLSTEANVLDKPLDRFFSSLARSFAHRALGVVLTGMLDDGAEGARELQRAGGRVVVQSEKSAEYAAMPRAAIRAGAADHVVPLAAIGGFIGELVARTPAPQMRSEIEAVQALFGGAGEARAQLREVDWSTTPLGPAREWSEALKTIARTTLASRFPMFVCWGPQFVHIVNDAFLPALGDKVAQGRRAADVWAEFWDYLHTEWERIGRTGQATWAENQLFGPIRRGFVEEAYFTYSYSPLYDDDGSFAGILATQTETTERVVAERRLETLRAVSAAATGDPSSRDVGERMMQCLVANHGDIPFALLYMLERDKGAVLSSACGVAAGGMTAPLAIRLQDEEAWPIGKVVDSNAALKVSDLRGRFPGYHAGPWEESPLAAQLLPLHFPGQEAVAGVLVLGTNPRRAFDARTQDFFALVAARVSGALADAKARELERERMERLAELDRAKTEFFANVSHEFRTPLTLLLAPLEELLLRRDELPASMVDAIDVASRNSRRLLTLVNNLLDFAQIESRQRSANLEVLDLGALTTDVVSHFRSAIEAAGLGLHVKCDASLPMVPVDPEMWTKVVSNLVANAFKFTFEGEISVAVHALRLHAELVVSDTGVGIPKEEMPNIFKRFHRVHGTRARTAEGAGLGLAIVSDLVNRMGGQVNMRSTEGRGSVCTVWLPYKSARMTGASPSPVNGRRPLEQIASGLAEQAARWRPEQPPEAVAVDLLGPPQPTEPVDTCVRPRILIADDNADIRDYLCRLLGTRWDVAAVADAAAALEAARRSPPAAILADVMMPGMDGFELLERLRDEPSLKHTPVVLVTARAGEEAAIQGLAAGADDYIAKPFSPRELIARIGAVIERARADAALRESEALLATVFQALPVGVGVLNPAGKTFLSNDEFRRFLPNATIPSYDPARGWRWSARAPDGKPLPPQQFPGARALRGDSVVPGIEMLYRDDGGTEIWTEVSAVPIKDADGTVKAAFAVVNDIDRLKRYADALRASEARFRLFVMASSDIIYRVSADWSQMLTLEGKGLLADIHNPSQTWLEQFIPESDKAFVRDAIAEAVRKRKTLEIEHHVMRADGTVGWVFSRAIPFLDERGDIVEWFGAAIDITERKRVAERQEFLLRLSDALRPLTDAGEIQAAAARILGEQLQVARAFYFTAEPDTLGGGYVHVITKDYFRDPGMRTIVGRYPQPASPPNLYAGLPKGENLVIDDVSRLSDAVPDYVERYLAFGVHALIVVPLVKSGQYVAAFGVNDAEPRNWTSDEIALVEETAERTWAAVARARAETALAKSEQRFRALFDSIDEGFCTIEVYFDDKGTATDYRFLEANPAFIKQTGLVDAIGRTMKSLAPEHEAFWFETYGRIALTGEPARFEHRAAQLGTYYDVFAFRIDEPQQHHVAILFNDISARKVGEWDAGLK